jgi:peptidoglycan/xylan/chitin deacetylase (PgdA/CDA1 family)
MLDQVDVGAAPWVLMYHSIADTEADPLNITVSPATFERQMMWLRRHGLRGTSLSETLDAGGTGAPGLVGLTFDDGYADFATTAVPILRRYGFTATVYVLAERLGGVNEWDQGAPRKRLMTAAQVRAVASAGMEVGSHGLRHVSLPTLSQSELTTEVEHSRTALSGLLDRQISGFAYPYGHFDDREVEAVRAAGYGHACGVGRARPESGHAMPRSFIGERDTGMRMAAKKARHTLFWRRSR